VDAQSQGSLRRISIEQPTHAAPPVEIDFTGVSMEDRKKLIYQKAFSKYDVNNDNTMSTAELKSLLQDLNWDTSEPAVEAVMRTTTCLPLPPSTFPHLPF
jgi:Ca2+-binding EF-hand superfamily protein